MRSFTKFACEQVADGVRHLYALPGAIDLYGRMQLCGYIDGQPLHPGYHR